MTYPIVPVTLPADLVGQPNGKLADHLLVAVDGGGRLHHLAARAWNAMRHAALPAGFELTYTPGGTYRSYEAQEKLFKSRYAPGGTFGGCKTWNGVQWCKTGNYATAAVPGTSNHGLGLAVDTALGWNPIRAITPAVPWLVANEVRFGFSHELVSEAWHVRYVAGDQIPQAVLDFETPTTPPPLPSMEDDEMFIVHRNTPGTAGWTATMSTGPHTSHLSRGDTYERLKALGVREVVLGDAEFEGWLRSTATTTDAPASLPANLRAVWDEQRA